MDKKLLNKAITIAEKVEKLQGNKTVMKVKDEKGLTYTVYKTKQDGSTSVAWDQILDLNIGDTVQIGYVEDLGEYQGKKVTYRTIRNFNKDIGEGQKQYNQYNPAPQAKSSNTGQSGRSGEVSRDEFSRRLGIQGHLNALLSNPTVIGGEERLSFKGIIRHAIQIEDELEVLLNPSPVRQAVLKSNPQFFDDPTNGEMNPMVNDDEPPLDLYDDIPFGN